MRRVFKHLTFSDRLKIEALSNAGNSPKKIAEAIHVHVSTIYRELRRGVYERLNSDYTTETRYSPDIAEQAYRANLAAKGADLKIGKDHELAEYIEKRIIEDKYSPAAVLGEIDVKGLRFRTRICRATLYSYIEKGVFLRLTNKHLPVKGDRKRRYRRVKQAARPPKGESIEKRPEEVEARSTFGHWEMDLVVGRAGGSKKVLLTLTERLTRNEIIVRLKDKTTDSVVKALDGLEKRYGEMFPRVFRSITVDNGSEFMDCEGMKKTYKKRGIGPRTTIYYCHPYSAYERGSNENGNRMIRRFAPKGTDFGKVPPSKVSWIESWLNNYPRAIHGYRTAGDLFREQIAALSR